MRQLRISCKSFLDPAPHPWHKSVASETGIWFSDIRRGLKPEKGSPLIEMKWTQCHNGSLFYYSHSHSLSLSHSLTHSHFFCSAFISYSFLCQQHTEPYRTYLGVSFQLVGTKKAQLIRVTGCVCWSPGLAELKFIVSCFVFIAKKWYRKSVETWDLCRMSSTTAHLAKFAIVCAS